jgi:hypothetical protein
MKFLPETDPKAKQLFEALKTKNEADVLKISKEIQDAGYSGVQRYAGERDSEVILLPKKKVATAPEAPSNTPLEAPTIAQVASKEAKAVDVPKSAVPTEAKREAFGMFAGVELERDEDGNVVGIGIDPAKMALGFGAMGLLKKVGPNTYKGQLFHGTSKEGYNKILKDGFKITKSAYGRRFGDVVYFAEEKGYARERGKVGKTVDVTFNGKLKEMDSEFRAPGIGIISDYNTKLRIEADKALLKAGYSQKKIDALSYDDNRPFALEEEYYKLLQKQGYKGIRFKGLETIIFDPKDASDMIVKNGALPTKK